MYKILKAIRSLIFAAVVFAGCYFIGLGFELIGLSPIRAISGASFLLIGLYIYWIDCD